MIKDYNILKSNVFPAPYNKEGLKIKLDEKRAADYVQKGELAELSKSPKTVAKEKKPKKVVKK